MKRFKILLIIMVLLCLLSACDVKDVFSKFGGDDEKEALAERIPTTPEYTEPIVETSPSIMQTEPAEDPQVFYVKTNDNLFVRSGPGTQYAQLRILPRGQMVTVLYFDGNWGYIGDGWVRKEYLSESPLSATETEEAPGTVISSHNGYYISRLDRSYYNNSGQVVISHYYDFVVLTGNSEAIDKINQQLQQLAESFLWSDETMNNHAKDKNYNHNQPWYYTKTSQVQFSGNDYVRITVNTSWYMGGKITNNSETYVFDLATGNPTSMYP